MDNSMFNNFNQKIRAVQVGLRYIDAQQHLCDVFSEHEYSLFVAFTDAISIIRISNGKFCFPNLEFQEEFLELSDPYIESEMIQSQILLNLLTVLNNFPVNSASFELVEEAIDMIDNIIYYSL